MVYVNLGPCEKAALGKWRAVQAEDACRALIFSRLATGGPDSELPSVYNVTRGWDKAGTLSSLHVFQVK